MKPFYISLKPFLNHGELPRPALWPVLFGNNNPIEVEIGFGNGEYLARLSQGMPQVNFIGFEEYCERIVRTLRKLSRNTVNNARVMRLDARAGFERYIKPNTIQKIHCLYPPPWPKKSDIKHRLFTPAFLKLLNSRLVMGGHVHIVTDHYPYMLWLMEQLPGTGFQDTFNKIPASFGTKFENKWVGEGQQEFYELILTKEQHHDIPLTEDTPMQMYTINDFDPDRFVFNEYSKDGIAVAFRDMLYDAKKKMALVHVIACDGPITQNVRVMIVHTPKGWRVHLAEGSLLMPTVAVSQAVACVHEAAVQTTA